MILDLSVSIVTYNEIPERLDLTIQSILNSNIKFELHIVDNSPTEDLKNWLKADPRLKYHHLPGNPGFGAAHNLAIRLSDDTATYHLVLNPDVSFGPDLLNRMIRYMEDNPQIGLLSPKVFYPDGSLQRLCKLLPTPMDVVLRRLFPNARFVAKRNERYELIDYAYERICKIPSLSGCFMLLRRKALRDVGLFDERFFMYFEDVDLTRRIGTKYETIFNPNFSITHYYGKGSYKSFKLLKIHMLSAILYFNKWGWIFDSYRKSANCDTISNLSSLLSKESIGNL